MSSLTPERSSMLSLLLDDVVGTPEVIKIRRDACRIFDRLLFKGVPAECSWYYTGSKAEGLDLPGSDNDAMFDINDIFHLTVVQTLDNISDITPSHGLFLMCTDNVPPCFALLRRLRYGVNPIHTTASQYINGIPYLSSNLLMTNFGSYQFQDYQVYKDINPGMHLKNARQGPSIEIWTEFQDYSLSGTDGVMSIRCPFWPTGAQEWIDRPRHFQWPNPRDLTSITSFGCHLVSVAHPNSSFNRAEWRISFSVAERILVWSFSHVQLQCYAVMKVILKEFIKLKCTPTNFVLCSYFIKTFLFWKFETTNSCFWCRNNLADCIRFLMNEFYQYIRKGILRHYFFPAFNLLSVKLTQAAQAELLKILDIAIQRDIRIFHECRTLRNVWSRFAAAGGHRISIETRIRSNNFLQIENNIMEKVHEHIRVATTGYVADCSTTRMSDISCETILLSLILKCLRFHKRFKFLRCADNKDFYTIKQFALNGEISLDLSTCKLWYATLLFMKGEYVPALTIVNQMLSSIPPYALFYSYGAICSRNETKNLYTGMFINSDMATKKKARTSWLFDLHFSKQCTDNVPLAIQIELYFSDFVNAVQISPFAFAYYLMFVCYHELRQYDKRERSLRHLVDVVHNSEQCGNNRHHSYNLAGHCLLVVGKTHRAREMFRKSYQFIRNCPRGKYNSASWYMQNFC